MARRHHRRHHYRRNPSFSTGRILGDVTEAAWGAGGLAGTALLGDRYLSPIAQRFNSTGNAAVGKLIDFASSLLSANVIGWAVEKVSASGGRLARLGGLFYAGGKLISIPFSDFQITASVPALAGLAGGATNALPVAGGAATGAVAGKSPAGSQPTTAGIVVSDPGQYVGF